MVSMSEMPGYEWPTFIMISRSVRPMATLTADTEPGSERAHAAVHADRVGDRPAHHHDRRLRSGRHREGAQADRVVEHALGHGEDHRHRVGLRRRPSPRWRRSSRRCRCPCRARTRRSRRRPARPDAATIASTFSRVGGTSGRPSLQPLLDERARSSRRSTSSRSSPSNVELVVGAQREVLERRPGPLRGGRGGEALDHLRHRVVDHLRDVHGVAVGERQRRDREREVGAAEHLGREPRVLLEPDRDPRRPWAARAPRTRPSRA